MEILDAVVQRHLPLDEVKARQSLILQCGRCYRAEYKEMNLLYPNPTTSNKGHKPDELGKLEPVESSRRLLKYSILSPSDSLI
jgi:hypothetical protein